MTLIRTVKSERRGSKIVSEEVSAQKNIYFKRLIKFVIRYTVSLNKNTKNVKYY